MVTFPSDSQFSPLLQGTTPLIDPAGDVNPIDTDIVGSDAFPAVYMAYDGTNMYFRMRLNGDPRQKTGFSNFAWGFLFDTDNNPATYEWLIAVNGLRTTLDLVQNTIKENNSWNDPAEGTDGRGSPNVSLPIINYDIVRARLTGDGSNFSGNPDYFLDFFIPSALFFSTLGITATTPIRMLFFTATNNNNFNKDTLQAQGFSFSQAFSNPTTPASTNVRASLTVSKTITSGPTSVAVGALSVWQEALTVTNTGKSAANLVFASSIITLEQVVSVTFVAPGNTMATYNPLNKTITWNIGNLAAGASITLPIQLNGQFTTVNGGVRTLNRGTATGIDSFSGTPINSGSTEVTVNVALAPTTGSASGTVLDRSTGLPIQGVVLSLLDAALNVIRTTTSDIGGAYGFSELPPRAYTLRADASGAGYSITDTSVTITAGQGTANTVFLTPLPAAVQGTITDNNNAPLAGATLLLKDALAHTIASAITDGNGQYILSNLMPDFYTLSASLNGFQSKVVSENLGRGQTDTVNFVLQPNPGSLSGLVTDVDTGLPIPGTLVEILGANRLVFATTVTDANGTYAVAGLAPGNDRVRFTAVNYSVQLLGVTVSPGTSLQLNAQLQTNPGALTGTVTDNGGQPLADISIRIVNNLGLTLATANTDAAGTFTIDFILPPGTYSVSFSGQGYASQTVGAIVLPGQSTPVSAILSPLAGSIQGVITDASTTQPLPDASVRILFNDLLVFSTTTDSNGAYFISNVGSGNYQAAFSAAGYGTATVGAIVLPHQIATASAALQPLVGSVSGVITDSSGGPISSAVITVRSNTGGGPVITRVISNVNGSYSVPSLSPGTYVLTVTADGFENGICSVTVIADTNTECSITLQSQPGFISGKVISLQNGLPISGAAVEIRLSDQNGTVVSTLYTDANGNFLSPGLLPATYTIAVIADGFQIDGANVVVLPNATTPITIGLNPNPGSVTGSVFDSQTNLPLVGALAKVVNANGFRLAVTVTDSNGQFTFSSLPPDQYTVTASTDGYQANTVGVIVQPGLTTPTAIGLVPQPGTITGLITPNVPNAIVKLYNGNHIFIAVVATDENGRYTFTNLAPGNYEIAALAPEYAASTAGAFVNSNATTELNITLQPNPAQFSGTITSSNGLPITNAQLRVLDNNENILSIGLSDIAGNYFISNLPPGNHSVVISAPNFSTLVDGVALTPGASLSNINFVLIPNPGSISGNVRDRVTGEVISGASISIRTPDAQGVLLEATVTSIFGNFTFVDLPAGSYSLIIRADGYATQELGEIIQSGVNTTANILLDPSFGRINGNVVTTSGAPVTGNSINIRIYDEKGALFETIVANSNGTFTVQDLPTGNYQVSVNAPGFAATAVPVQVTTGLTIPLTLTVSTLLSAVTGNVLDASTNQPLSGSTIAFKMETGEIVTSVLTGQEGSYQFPNLQPGTGSITCEHIGYGEQSQAVQLPAGASQNVNFILQQNAGGVFGIVTDVATGNTLPSAAIQIFDSRNTLLSTHLTDSIGQYMAEGLSPGTYKAVASERGFSSQSASFTIEPGTNTRLSFALTAIPGEVAGTVRSQTGLSPVANTIVAIRIFNVFGDPLATVTTGPDGTYRIGNLPTGNYTLSFTAPNFSAYTTSVLIGIGERVQVDVVLQPNAPVVQGTVRPTIPVPPTPPTVVNEAQNGIVRVIDANNTVVREVQTFPGGAYLVNNAVPGDVAVYAQLPNQQFEEQSADLAPNQQATLNFTLPPNPATVTGRVLDREANNPIVGAIVQVLNENRTVTGIGLTDGEGRFQIGSLRPGTYFITVTAPGFGSQVQQVVLAAGQLLNVDFTLSSLPGNLTGVVRDEQSRPLFRALVIIFVAGQIPLRTVITNEQGQYGVFGLDPGTYTAQFSYPDKRTRLVPFTITSLSTTTLDVILVDEEEE
ncbi:carboxypeptidase regulatory-like domain-containing protein [Paenibacillus sp. SC116]|uniref:carboxypeptidase regulatory-like domain-containing protein n=1 Tax=Paenibacillus sp. SC116 TaxID=2968986 RepID=UPI00215AC4C9|nr:carboxypeptidase regulatory-like domain-containing protein [Paenibacillus sp. SC116]MCR8845088.1 carboxypeptidase regulatory-like domain-containing protein [Paenibacillus sp. SC116]